MTLALTDSAQRHIAVVVAALDEGANIQEIYTRLRRALLALPDTRSELIWVTEGTDGTTEILKRLAQNEDEVSSTIIEPLCGVGSAPRFA
jgi:hypothetical protein